ncbi:MAG: mechanosensitive ion channel domain-containing protein, partial [Pseudomonadota bacterium]
SITDLLVAAQRLSEGFSVGETRFSPTDLLIVVAVLVTGLWLTRFLQRLLRSSVLPNMGIDRGAQTSLSAGFGYLGFFVTALLAISAAGLDLSNLAIVAGALSVGIGFGLQNIVNNFVSGIILLAERPIKVGDWIEVGGAGGYVRRVNVRSTEIETFDRASVIVPNSDLISNQVTNWTHKTMSGRVIAKVGVSYDCDPEQVRAILQEVGASHPMVLRFPKPVVLFRGFGDSALDFELRVIIRDVNWMLSVQSDLNLAIYKRFKEEGIEIPFPQRVLHVTGGAVADDGATAGNGHAAEVPPLTAVPPKA